ARFDEAVDVARDTLAALAPGDLPMPVSRARALLRVTELLAAGDIDVHPGADREDVSSRLLAVPGVGPWTVAYVRMRALGDPDAFMAGDLGVRRALESHGLPGGERSALSLAERWRPYRAYALQYLWSGPVGHLATDHGDDENHETKEKESA
ncbi:MAG: DNA-3-methyladenine glycosylase family protein, partial [Acidimicrobiales bacterium]